MSKIGTSERLLTTIVKRKMAFVGHIFRKDDICKDLLLVLCIEKEEEVDRGPGVAITFEDLVGIGALLIYID